MVAGTNRQHPFWPEADEKALLGALFLKANLLDSVRSEVPVEAFGHPRTRDTYEQILRADEEGKAIDPASIGERLARARGIERKDGIAWCMELQESCGATSRAPEYAATVLEWYDIRRLRNVRGELERLEDAPSGETLDEVRSGIAERLEEIERSRFGARLYRPESLTEFLASTPRDYDWVIPGLLERKDRMMVVAGEGGGKSYLLRQLAFAAAAGLHPFGGRRYTPRNVLLIDLENGRKTMARVFERFWETAANLARADWDPDRITILHRPEGCNVLTIEDRAWLRQVCQTVLPDLIVVGPLYKLWAPSGNRAGDGGEDDARRVAGVLDEIRETVGCAVVMEHHAAKGGGFGRSLSPVGSSLWMRWPEFGLTIEPDHDGSPDPDNPDQWFLGRFRGDREPRQWPRHLRRGTGSHEWPWESVTPTARHDNYAAVYE
ncbi:MAG: AAA family ATPase [Actinomycetota bacterium]